MLRVDGDTVFLDFSDGVLGCTTADPLGSPSVRAFRGHADNGDTIRERRDIPIGDRGPTSLEPMSDEPSDPFRDESPFGPWHYSLREGEMLVQGLADLPDITTAIIAVKNMSREDLESVVLERLYVMQASQKGPVSREFHRWLYSEPDPDS